MINETIKHDKIGEAILKSARIEFTQFGYRAASVRRICKEAGVTTGALYKRYKGKEDLFAELVRPTLEQLELLELQRREHYYNILKEDKLFRLQSYNIEDMQTLMAILYEYKQDIQLILFKSEGSLYTNFKNNIASYDIDETYDYLLKVHERKKISYLPDKRYLEGALRAYYNAFFTPLEQDWSKEMAIEYCQYLARLFDWSSFFGLIDKEEKDE